MVGPPGIESVSGAECRVMAILVCGPIGSGKSTYVREHMDVGDIVVDLDEIFKAFTFLPMYEKPVELLQLMLEIKGFVVMKFTRDLLEGNEPERELWIIECAPTKKQRRKYESLLNAKVVMLDVAAEECKGRISRQGRDNLYEQNCLIDDWWAKYRSGA